MNTQIYFQTFFSFHISESDSSEFNPVAAGNEVGRPAVSSLTADQVCTHAPIPCSGFYVPPLPSGVVLGVDYHIRNFL
jgi:hypothetical protein